MISAVLGEAACCRVEVAAIERLVELFGYAPIGIGGVPGSLSYRLVALRIEPFVLLFFLPEMAISNYLVHT